jgi:hypothetical protein
VWTKSSGGKAPYTYTWTSDGKPSSVNSSGLKGKRKKDATLVVEVRDGNGQVVRPYRLSEVFILLI